MRLHLYEDFRVCLYRRSLKDIQTVSQIIMSRGVRFHDPSDNPTVALAIERLHREYNLAWKNQPFRYKETCEGLSEAGKIS